MKERLSNHSDNVVIADPYFDTTGLEFVSYSTGAAKGIVVLTCSKIPSEDDQLPANTGVKRAVRLTSACKVLFPILKGLRLRIFDLQSKGGGDKQLFHDRYILFYAEDGRAESGYNLSTSLQSATRTTPLLVTPIPDDILDDVSDYVTALINGDAGQATADVVQLFPDATTTSRPHGSALSEKDATAVSKLLALIRGHTPSADLKVALESSGGAC